MKSDFNMFCLFLVKDRFKETEYKTVFITNTSFSKLSLNNRTLAIKC